MTLTELAHTDDTSHGRWHRGAEAARADLRRALTADQPDTAIAAWLKRDPAGTGRTDRAGYRAIQNTAAQLLTNGTNA